MRVRLLHPPGPATGRVVEAAVRTDGEIVLHPLAVESGLEAVGPDDGADLSLVPVRWQDLDRAGRHAVMERARADPAHPVVIWSNSDWALDVTLPNVVVVEVGGERDAPDATRRVTVPPFFGDLQLATFGREPEVCDRVDPVIGFCGQTTYTLRTRATATLSEARHRVARRLDRRPGALRYLPEPWSARPWPGTSHLRLRRRALALLEAHPAVETDFVRRSRGGATDDAARARFAASIADTDHTLCIRGTGNFSVRLPQTLCLGRVPVVVDSGGRLPWPDHRFWSEVALVLPESELDRIGDHLVAHHARLRSEIGLPEAQRAARAFWVERVGRRGFLRHLDEALRPAVLAASAPPGGSAEADHPREM